MIRISETEFLALYDEHADAVFRLCLYKTSDREEAKDLAQEAFTRVWREAARGKEIRDLRAFLYTVARNLIKDYYKRKKPVQERDLPEGILETVPTGSTAEHDAESNLVIRAIAELPDRYREAATLHFIEGLPIQEIAELLGERPNTISVRVKRALEKLRATLHLTNP